MFYSYNLKKMISLYQYLPILCRNYWTAQKKIENTPLIWSVFVYRRTGAVFMTAWRASLYILCTHIYTHIYVLKNLYFICVYFSSPPPISPGRVWFRKSMRVGFTRWSRRAYMYTRVSSWEFFSVYIKSSGRRKYIFVYNLIKCIYRYIHALRLLFEYNSLFGVDVSDIFYPFG